MDAQPFLGRLLRPDPPSLLISSYPMILTTNKVAKVLPIQQRNNDETATKLQHNASAVPL